MNVPAPVEDYQDEFARIEAAVAEGETDLAALGFWRLLSQVKRDPVLSSHWADAAGRIDRVAFESRVRLRFPIWFGNAVLVGATAAGVAAVIIAVQTTSPMVAGLALVFAAADWSASVHGLAHWLAGRVAQIRFTSYFFDRRFPPTPGLKTDYATYLRASPEARAWMHASGAIASKIAPLVALAFWPATVAPVWAALVIAAYTLVLIVIDVVYSVRYSDWKKVRRELRVARGRAASR
ncbi:MAG TPA: hypothetical protein VFZ50_08695 [Actinomycetota bacterium]|nr:hypothetical protein [Actinomycetota bacterium]